MTTAMIIPDLQVPLHDPVFVEKLIDVAEYISPDILLFIGDLTDSTEVGRWVKGRSGEYTGNLQAAFNETRSIVARFRRAVGQDAEMILIRSNHDDRTEEYISANAPALASFDCLDFPTLIGLGDHHVQYVAGPYEFLPGCVAVHGHERAYSSVPGKYGLLRAVEYGANVVYGHTHTPLLVTTSQGYHGRTENRWAMNVGHGMDMTQASYLKDGYATWAQGFGVVTYEDGVALPELILAMDGKFVYRDVIW